jgi:arylsulfatase
MKKKNIVIIHTDEHVFSFLGCMGNRQVKTPNIDQLAANGMRFDNAYTCNGVCMPSRASLLTGRYPVATGVTCNEQRLPAAEKIMGEYFVEAGYRTGYFGKTHYGRDDKKLGDDGWQESFAWQLDYRKYLDEQKIAICYPERSEIRMPEIRYWNIGPSNIPYEHFFEKVIADRAIEFIGNNSAEPFLCFVGNVAPHSPFTPPEPYASMYDPDKLDLAPRADNELENKPPEFIRWIEQNRKYANEQELKIYMAMIYGLITMVDDQVGRIVSALKEQGVYDDTVIIFTSDHGDFSSAYGIIGKSWCMDDRLMRVPLIISHPDYRTVVVNDSLTDNTDILPTLMDIAGIVPPERIHGVSLLPVIAGETDAVREQVFGFNEFHTRENHLHQGMLRQGKWKLVQSNNFKGELYDLDTDPYETTNLIDLPEHCKLIIKLREALLRCQIRYSGGFYDIGNAGYWEDKVNFYDEKLFSGG